MHIIQYSMYTVFCINTQVGKKGEHDIDVEILTNKLIDVV